MKLVSHKYFSYFTFLLIFVDCNLLVWENDHYNIELFISIFYLIEMFFKMISFGLCFDETSYFRNKWNFIDFFIVLNLFCTRMLSYLLLIDISSLRNLIVLRLLKIPPFQVIIEKLYYTFEALMETFSIFILFIIIFSILSLQLFNGLLKFHCIELKTGLPNSKYEFCSLNDKCPAEGYICSKLIDNPESGITNFDNFITSFIQIFRIVSLDNWTSVMLMLQKGFSIYIWIYIFIIIVVCNFFLLNMMLAVLKVKFSEQRPNAIIDFYLEKYKEKSFDLREIKKSGLYRNKKRNFKRKEGVKSWEGFKLFSIRNLFSAKKTKMKNFENFLKQAINKKVLTSKQSLKLKKILDKKKSTLMNSICMSLKNKNFEIRVKKNDRYESESLADVLPTKFII